MTPPVRTVLALTSAMLLAACDDKPAAPGAPGTPAPPGAAAPAPAAAPALPATPVADAGATIAAITGSWVIDLEASERAMTDAAKVSILQGGAQYTEAQVKEAVRLTIESTKNSDIVLEVKADGTYALRTNISPRPVLGTVTVRGGEFTLIPDDQSTVVRAKLVGGKLVNQRPRDPTASFLAYVWTRK